MRQAVVFDDFVGAMPVEEIVFDLGALRVVTDMALTGVASEVGPWWAELAASGDFVDLHDSFLLSLEASLGLEKYAPTHASAPCVTVSIAETTQTKNGGNESEDISKSVASRLEVNNSTS